MGRDLYPAEHPEFHSGYNEANSYLCDELLDLEDVLTILSHTREIESGPYKDHFVDGFIKAICDWIG